MSSVRRATIPLTGPVPGAQVVIALLPRTSHEDCPPPLVDLRGDPSLDPGCAPVQALEGKEYRFELTVPGFKDALLETDKPDVLTADTETGDTGRFRPGLHTGTITVRVRTAADQFIGSFSIEVRSRKFDYLNHYRWMLRDLAEILAEVVMERFAAAEQRFTIDDTRDAVTLYQRFVLLQSLLTDERLEGALRFIAQRPYVVWHQIDEIRPVQRGLRGGSSAIRELTRGGPRVMAANGPLESLPRRVRSKRTITSTDNLPNRFVKFALTRWRNIVATIAEVLEEQSQSSVVRRGIQEVRALRDRLDALMAEELFREVAPLAYFPAESQVLQKRAGYRDVFQAFVMVELASKLTWAADDVFGAGQRDVATLYEYWAFLQLTQVVAEICGGEFDRSELFTLHSGGLTVGLRNGTWRAFHGTARSSGGRKMRLDLHFNKTFSPNQGSWSVPMRPDCSLRITSKGKAPLREEVWIHFDPKYRIDALTELFGSQEEAPEAATLGKAKRQDLLKMHSYRDAIQRSAGAYVLYPGSDTRRLKEYHEILPGLGAFPLYPTESGSVGGGSGLKAFVVDILDHVASQFTQRRRSTYWASKSFEENGLRGPLEGALGAIIDKPPADTQLLLGYVRSEEHLTWIREHGLYNLRADPARRGAVGLGHQELEADLVLLYGKRLASVVLCKVEGEPRVLNAERMRSLEYPGPGGDLYFALPVVPLHVAQLDKLLSYEVARRLAVKFGSKTFGAPAFSTWLEFCHQIRPGVA